MAKAAVEIELQGNVRAEAEALQKAFLNSLGWKGVRKLEQFATVNAARALAKPVREKAPTDLGGLAKSVRGRRSRITRPGAIVGPVAGKKYAWYAWFVVKGTKPHTIPRVTAANLFSDRKFIEHPGTRGDNFVIEAVEANIQLAKDAMSKTIVLLLNDEAMRANRNIITQDNEPADDGVGPHLKISPRLNAGVNDRCRMNMMCHI